MKAISTSLRSALVLAVAASALAAPAVARDGDDALLPRGSNQWFVTESLEHSVRSLVLSGTTTAIEGASVELQSAARALVTLSVADGDVTYLCTMFDDFSHSGTVVKKEVACVR